jgi:phage tail sheath protein FI
MPNYQAPGVYVEEINALPSSIVAVPTAVPAFIGHTPRASRNRHSLRLRPTRITSFAEYQSLFGVLAPDRVTSAPDSAQISPRYTLVPAATPANADLTLAGHSWNLQADGSTLSYFHGSLKLFYANGGGTCYIVSVGALRKAKTAADAHTNPHVKLDDLLAGLTALERESEPTLIVVPDATLLDAPSCAALNEATLHHCQGLRSRVAVLDIRGADAPDPSMWTNDLTAFRSGIGQAGLNYGAAYYPFLRTTIFAADNITAKNLGGARAVRRVLPDATTAPVKTLLTEIGKRPAAGRPSPAQLDAELRAVSPAYAQIHALLLARVNTLPPSGAVAGVITTVDGTRGVWKAPANLALQSVIDLTIALNERSQETLKVDPATGKSINAIRTFPGQGPVVWGARTLDGNSSEWRYLSVRRTTIMVGQSIKFALQAFVFEPNDADTWTKIRSMIENFLIALWRQGALAGTKPQEAFAVQIGLGSTMTAQDIIGGTLKVSVMLALIRPAEFLVLTFQQKQAT